MTEIRRKIIIVDDINFSLQTFKGRLKEQYQVYPAQSVEELFERLGMVLPDLILLDIGMPGTDGFEIIKMLKNDPRYSYIPVIFLSSRSDRKSITKGLSLGAIDFIIKPFKDSHLIECIESHLDPSHSDSLKPIIMAVDDNPSVLRTIKAILDDDYKVFTITEPQFLHETLKRVTPDLFLLDCKMPIIDGFELVPIIRKTPLHHETPIVFLTSEGTVDNLSVAMSLGSSDFLVKPIDEEILKQKVKASLKDYMTNRLTRHL